jgi:hypothetical protein
VFSSVTWIGWPALAVSVGGSNFMVSIAFTLSCCVAADPDAAPSDGLVDVPLVQAATMGSSSAMNPVMSTRFMQVLSLERG